MTVPTVLQPWKCRGLELANRVAVAPMCTGMAEPGTNMPNRKHLVHYGAISQGGYGLLLVEATVVEYAGSISAKDMGIYTDEQVEAHKKLNNFIHTNSPTKTCLQIAHAGRKGVVQDFLVPKPIYLGPEDKNGAQSVSASPVAYDDRSPVPHALTETEIGDLVQKYTKAAANAVSAGYDALEIHGAHGYLLNQFMSPLTNQRTDQYGGSIDNRIRLTLDIITEVRKVMPMNMPLFLRISAVDWVDGGWTIEDSIYLAKKVKTLGVDVIDVSSGGVSAEQNVLLGWNYQTDLAQKIREEAKIETMAVGMIKSLERAQEVLDQGCSDLVAVGRCVLKDPYWLRNEAATLGWSAWYPKYQQMGYFSARKIMKLIGRHEEAEPTATEAN